MSKPENLNYYFEWSRQFPHIAAVDLLNNNVAVEIAVMSIDVRNADLYFIRLDQLDPIDIKRLRNIILKRDAARYALWDLMSQSALPNGMNSLEFFQQFVKVRTATGKILTPGSGQRGLPTGEHGYKGPASQGYTGSASESPVVAETPVETNSTASDGNEYEYEDVSDIAPVVVAPARRKAGRPKSKTS